MSTVFFFLVLAKTENTQSVHRNEDRKEGLELPFSELDAVANATDNFLINQHQAWRSWFWICIRGNLIVFCNTNKLLSLRNTMTHFVCVYIKEMFQSRS